MIWQGKELKTAGEVFDAALACADDEAEAFLRLHADECKDCGGMATAKSNLGYFAGYYSEETRREIERKFGAIHPVFGSATPTPKEAFELGLQRGKAGHD